MTHTTDQERQFATLRAQFAMKGHTLHRTSPTDGAVSFYAECRGLVRHMSTLDAAQRFLTQIWEAVMTFNRNLLPVPVNYFEEQGLKLFGPRSAKWKTTECRFHGGSDSMRVNLVTGAFSCMAGCGARGGDVLAYQMAATGAEFVDAAKAIGAWVDDGKLHSPQKPAPLSPRAALSVMAFEATLTAISAGNIASGVILTERDRARLITAANRINRLVEAYA